MRRLRRSLLYIPLYYFCYTCLSSSQTPENSRILLAYRWERSAFWGTSALSQSLVYHGSSLSSGECVVGGRGYLFRRPGAASGGTQCREREPLFLQPHTHRQRKPHSNTHGPRIGFASLRIGVDFAFFQGNEDPFPDARGPPPGVPG